MSNRSIIKVMHLIARLNIGGPAVYTISLLKNLPDDHYQTLLVCGKVGQDEGDMSYLAEEKGIRPYYLRGLGRDISVWRDLKSYISLIKIISRFNPEIIQTHTAKAGTLGRFATIILNILSNKEKKIKLIHTFHGHVFHSYFNPVRSFIIVLIERLLAKFTDRIIVISPKQKHEICETYRITNPEKVSIIPLGFNLDPFSSQENNGLEIRKKYVPKGKDDVMLVGIIGRLTKVKNHQMFLDSIKQLKDEEKIDLFRFLIVGDGELKEDLLRYSKDLGIEDYLFFIGWQKDMPSIYDFLDMVVLTSLNEGTPVTLIEAMAAGKPIIATDVGGVPDLMGEIKVNSGKKFQFAENGILIPSGDSNALSEAIFFILENRGDIEKMTKRARDYILRNYSMERLVEEIGSLYTELTIKS